MLCDAARKRYRHANAIRLQQQCHARGSDSLNAFFARQGVCKSVQGNGDDREPTRQWKTVCPLLLLDTPVQTQLVSYFYFAHAHDAAWSAEDNAKRAMWESGHAVEDAMDAIARSCARMPNAQLVRDVRTMLRAPPSFLGVQMLHHPVADNAHEPTTSFHQQCHLLQDAIARVAAKLPDTLSLSDDHHHRPTPFCVCPADVENVCELASWFQKHEEVARGLRVEVSCTNNVDATNSSSSQSYPSKTLQLWRLSARPTVLRMQTFYAYVKTLAGCKLMWRLRAEYVQSEVSGYDNDLYIDDDDAVSSANHHVWKWGHNASTVRQPLQEVSNCMCIDTENEVNTPTLYCCKSREEDKQAQLHLPDAPMVVTMALSPESPVEQVLTMLRAVHSAVRKGSLCIVEPVCADTPDGNQLWQLRVISERFSPRSALHLCLRWALACVVGFADGGSSADVAAAHTSFCAPACFARLLPHFVVDTQCADAIDIVQQYATTTTPRSTASHTRLAMGSGTWVWMKRADDDNEGNEIPRVLYRRRMWQLRLQE